MKVVESASEAAEAMESAAREAQAYFGRPEIYVERYLGWPRHVEMQVLGDTHGNMLWLGERDCSAQRRHQKLVEESPAPAFPDEVRQAMGEAAVKVSEGVRLLQRRHRRVPLPGRRVLLPGDEYAPSGRAPGDRACDRPGPRGVADPHRLGRGAHLRPRRHPRNGHAIEVRINAEDPSGGRFSPSPGTITNFTNRRGRRPPRCGVPVRRPVTQFYDNLIAKLVVWAPDREPPVVACFEHSTKRALKAISTTFPADVVILAHADFVDGTHSTRWVEDDFDLSELTVAVRRRPAVGSAGEAVPPWTRRHGRGERASLHGDALGARPGLNSRPRPQSRRSGPADDQAVVAGTGSGDVTVPMQGTIVKVLVVEGDKVEAGETSASSRP